MKAFGATVTHEGVTMAGTPYLDTDVDTWPCGDILYDDYDTSFELWECKDDWAPTEEQYRAALALGFSRGWFCYPDGTERYGLGPRLDRGIVRDSKEKYLLAKRDALVSQSATQLLEAQRELDRRFNLIQDREGRIDDLEARAEQLAAFVQMLQQERDQWKQVAYDSQQEANTAFDQRDQAVAERSALRQQREISIAEAIARMAHRGQVTGSEGMDYITHPAAVAALLPDELKPAGWLHDVIEDSAFTAEDLSAAGISQRTIEIVLIVSRSKDFETYAAFIQRIAASGNDGAIRVKLADLRHNLRPSCPDSLRARYLPAVEQLDAALAVGRSPEAAHHD